MAIRAPSPLPSLTPSRPRGIRSLPKRSLRADTIARNRRSHPFLTSLGFGSRSSGRWGLADRRRRVLDPPIVARAVHSNANPHAKEPGKKRKVVEHVYLVKAKADLSDDKEKDMLDYLYTSQYQTRGVLAISLGRITDLNVEGFTHAVFMRFQMKEDLLKFYTNSYYLGVLKDHVIPYSYESISIDYESEVEDDILPIFRRGEDFNYGVEFVLLISVHESALGDAVEDALNTLCQVIMEFEAMIVQATLGANLNVRDNGYTHGAVIRFPSREALETFRGSSEFEDLQRQMEQIISDGCGEHRSGLHKLGVCYDFKPPYGADILISSLNV